MDFSTLVLGPCLDAFGVPIVVYPVRSQPWVTSYCGRAVWESRHTDVVLDDGSVVSSNQMDIGIRLSEFTTPPAKGDNVQVNCIDYNVFDINLDGQGGAKLILRLASSCRDIV